MNNIKNKVALITGGSKGIGYGIAEMLMQEGMHVCITARHEDDVKKAAKKLEDKYEGKAIGLTADVRQLNEMSKVVEETTKQLGSLDALIANAGVGHFGSIEEMTSEQWNQTIETNLTGVFNTLKPAIAPLKKSKGYFITIASLAGTNFFAGGSAYNASKFGLVGFTQAAMLDLRQSDIKVTTIMPGSVASYFNDHTPSSEDDWKIQPEDIGEMIVYLLKSPQRTLPSKIEVRPTKPPKK